MITKRKYPWIGIQNWTNTLFLHWPVAPEIIRPFVPEAFHLDLFDDKAWISFVLFQGHQTRGRMMPRHLSLPTLHQLNIRTYVYYQENDERGVYFIKVYTNSIVSIFGARTFYQLPFHYASFFEDHWNGIQLSDKNGKIFSVEYEPVIKMEKDELSSFLTERYCIWNMKGSNAIKIPVLHKKWKLQKVNVVLNENRLFPFSAEKLDTLNYISHFSPYKHAVLFPYEVKGKI